jgi:hypothetical protein
MLANRRLKTMCWLSSTKVRLGLIINGLYFISLFTPTTEHRRPNFFSQAREHVAEREATTVHPDPVLPPPTNAPGSALVSESNGMLNVSLNKELTLVYRPGRKVILAPWFSVRARRFEEPKSVLFSFVIYTNNETCAGDCPLTITADGVTVWTSYSHGDSHGWLRRSRVPGSSAKLEDGRSIETMSAELLSTLISYKGFVDMIGAKRVVIRLGPDWVELTPDQLEALRDMHRRLLPQPDDADSH